MERIAILLFVSLGLLFPRIISGAAASGESRFLDRPRQLILEGKRSGEGYFSPDGKALIFQSEREPENPFYQIYLLDLESGETHRVSPGSGKTTCAFFRPGSDEVMFASTHLDPETAAKQKAEIEFRNSGKTRRYSWDYDASMDLFVARRDGSGLRRLTDSPGYDAEGAFSPDGRQIVFCSLRDAYPADKLSPEDRKRLETDPAWFGEIYLMDADGSNGRRLTKTPGYDGGPFFSPDGSRIIWRRFDAAGLHADVYTMKLDGTDVRRLTDFGAMSWAPYFHPSGRYAIFTANKLGFDNFELYLVDAAGEREPVRVTYSDGFDGLPVFSPDGAHLSWTSNRTPEKQSQIFLANWNHAEALKALEESPQRQAPSASPALLDPHQHPPTPTAAPSFKLSPISTETLKSTVATLASDALEGRMTGSAGASKAAQWIRDQLQAAGLAPLPSLGSWDQPFEFTASTESIPGQNRIELISEGKTKSFLSDTDFRPLSFTDNHSVTGEVVFAGYGLVVPGKAGEGYDSYAGLNVSNKVVLVLRYVPEGVDAARRQELNRYAGLRYKAMMAREHGAAALLVTSGPNSPNYGELVGLSNDGSLSGSGIACLSVSTNVVSALFEGTGKDLKTLQSGLDTENQHAEGSYSFTGRRLAVTTAIRHLKKSDRNLIGSIPPTAGVTDYVMIGAHYDHLGHGDGNSLNRKGEENQVHPGADDNASGVATVLEMARSLAALRQLSNSPARRGLIVALWSGEELGLLGSAHFAEHPPLPLSNVVAYVNFDMVGRLRENRLNLQGIGSSTRWRKLIEKRNVAAGFNLVLQEDPYLPTDVTSFYPKQIPVLNFFTGSHDDYHRPTDKPDTLNYSGMEQIATLAARLTADLLQPETILDYVKVTRTGSEGGSRETLRAYLGSIPDYATEVKGVKLSGVRGGSPADKAGLQGGDVIVEFAGQTIANIYDYTYALDAVKIGKPVTVVVLRNGEKRSLSVIPEARK